MVVLILWQESVSTDRPSVWATWAWGQTGPALSQGSGSTSSLSGVISILSFLPYQMGVIRENPQGFYQDGRREYKLSAEHLRDCSEGRSILWNLSIQWRARHKGSARKCLSSFVCSNVSLLWEVDLLSSAAWAQVHTHHPNSKTCSFVTSGRLMLWARWLWVPSPSHPAPEVKALIHSERASAPPLWGP